MNRTAVVLASALALSAATKGNYGGCIGTKAECEAFWHNAQRDLLMIKQRDFGGDWDHPLPGKPGPMCWYCDHPEIGAAKPDQGEG